MDIEKKPKVCAVHHCKNISDCAQTKVFFEFPSDKILKEKWKMVIGGLGRPSSRESNIFVCEDHFDLHEDTTNYIDYYMSADIELKLKSGVVPHRFMDRGSLENHEGKVTKDYVEVKKGSSDAENLQPDSNKNNNICKTNVNKINIISNVLIDIETELGTKKINNNIDKETIRSGRIMPDTETEIKYSHFLGMCKPLKIALYDLKYAVHRKLTSFEAAEAVDIEIDPIERDMSLKGNEIQTVSDLLRMKIEKRIKLTRKIFLWEQFQAQCIAICNQQDNFIEIYHLNSTSEITTYKSVNNLREIGFKGPKDRLKVLYTCCWFNREKFRPPFEFTKRKHLCEVYNCTCCCRNMPPTSHNTRDEFSISQSSVEWINKMVSIHKSLFPEQKETFSAIQKALVYNCNVRDRIVDTNKKDYESISIMVNNYYYKIDNGFITFHTKGLKCKIYPDIKLQTCCWYYQDKFANKLLTRKIHPSASKFMRTQHWCPIGECQCCCKPEPSKNSQLSRLKIAVRYTTNVSQRIRIKISFSNKSEPKPSTSRANSAIFTYSHSSTDKTPPVNAILPPTETVSQRSTLKVLPPSEIDARTKFAPTEIVSTSSIVSNTSNIENVLDPLEFELNPSTSRTIGALSPIPSSSTNEIIPVNTKIPPTITVSQLNTLKVLPPSEIEARANYAHIEIISTSSNFSKPTNIRDVVDSPTYPLNNSSFDLNCTSIGDLTDIVVENMVQDSNNKAVSRNRKPRKQKCRATSPSRCRCKASHLTKDKDSDSSPFVNNKAVNNHLSSAVEPVIVASANTGVVNTIYNLSKQGNSSIIQIADRLKNMNSINQVGGKLIAHLNTSLSNLSTTELKILNNIMSLVENKLKSAGLTEENVQFSLGNISNTMTLENKDQQSNEFDINTVKSLEDPFDLLTLKHVKRKNMDNPVVKNKRPKKGHDNSKISGYFE